jgi:Tol biopolymer transport system component
VSPDGKTLLYHESVEEGTELFVTQLSDPSKKQRVQHSAGNADNGVYSPNGKWIAYLSTISGRQEVYVTPSPGTAGGGRQQVTDGGGEGAEWAKDGTAIYYSFGGQIRRVKFNPVTGEIGSTQILNRIRPVQGWYVGPDGRFLTRRIAADAERHSVKILFNWTHALDAHN